jgi:uncharacterized membrane protein
VYLERVALDLQRDLQELREERRVPAAVPEQQPAPMPVRPASPVRLHVRQLRGADVVRSGEEWFSRIGIGLFLLGLALLFMYAVDQGWLTPSVRVGIGLVAGVALLGLGLRLRTARPGFAQVLQGGGVAALSLSDFAAFVLYGLVGYPTAFGLMCLVSALTFGLAIWQRSQPLALIAALGGLGTPFILSTGAGSAVGLVGYTCLLLSGIAAISLYQRWRLLVWVGVAGGWLVLLVAQATLPPLPAGHADRWAVQLGIVWASLLFWPLPVLQRLRWPVLQPARSQAPRWTLLERTDLAALVLSTPLIALALTSSVWELTRETAGGLALGLAGIAGLGAHMLRARTGMRLVRSAHTLVALLLLTAALVLVLEGNARLLALAIEGALIHTVAGRLHDRLSSGLAHLLFAALALALLARLVREPLAGLAFLNLSALTTLAVIGLALRATTMLDSRRSARIYWLAAHLLLLGLLAHELAPLPNGNGYVTLAWGLYGAALLMVGLRRDWTALELAGIGTLLLVVGKLLLVDLTTLAALWRILFFLGFGAAFLLLSYAVRALWHPSVAAPMRQATAQARHKP